MKNKSTLLIVIVGVCLTGAAYAGEIKRDLLNRPKISEDQATRIALKQVENGEIESKELETEKGKKVWSFDIKTKGSESITEVQVDANSGEVVSKKVESEADEEKEKKEDSKG